jgi:hypothetical protein
VHISVGEPAALVDLDVRTDLLPTAALDPGLHVLPPDGELTQLLS